MGFALHHSEFSTTHSHVIHNFITKDNQTIVPNIANHSMLALYNKMLEPVRKLVNSFFYLCSRDPLEALTKLKPFLNTISEFEENVMILSLNQPSINLIKLQDLHQVYIQGVQDTIASLVGGTEKSLEKHIKHLKYLMHNRNLQAVIDAERQIHCLHNHVQVMLKTSFFVPNLPDCMETLLRRLHNIIFSANKKIGQLVHVHSDGLVYGSEQWNLLVSSRTPLSQGLLSRVISYLKPFEYIPKKWQRTNKYIGNLFFHSLIERQKVKNTAKVLTMVNRTKVDAETNRDNSIGSKKKTVSLLKLII